MNRTEAQTPEVTPIDEGAEEEGAPMVRLPRVANEANPAKPGGHVCTVSPKVCNKPPVKLESKVRSPF